MAEIIVLDERRKARRPRPVSVMYDQDLPDRTDAVLLMIDLMAYHLAIGAVLADAARRMIP